MSVEKSPKPALIQAVIDQNETEVRRLLTLVETNVNVRNPANEYSALHYAAASGNNIILGLLIQKGAKLDAKGVHGETPISEATIRNHARTVTILAKAGADVNVQNDYSYTPVMEAAQTGMNAAAEALRQAGADFAIKDKRGMTAERHAILNLNKDFAKVAALTTPKVPVAKPVAKPAAKR